MMNFERNELIGQLDVLDDLNVWSLHALRGVRDGDDEKAAELIGFIIKTMEDPLVIKNLKGILAKLRDPF